MGVFYSYLMLFQGAMVGIVLSDNVLLLLVFWELTSLASFLLIGYWKHLPEGRQGARMALAVTGGGGLAMIAGMLILGSIAGSYDLSVILTQGEAIRASDWYLPALILILAGAFTKSAQFPFHFWLPHAMAAPTPVSAYLHSATMVKAGLFLMARMWPVLSGTEAWTLIVTTTGLFTMVIGAKIALFKHDLKALLAFSTVSHLGFITMLLGMGTKAAAVVAVFHIINHATFKCALFMAAGIVDHAAHTRDIRRLGGLRRLMPVTFGIVLVASLSMAGIPPLNGFLSKEMMLAETVETSLFGIRWLAPALATAAAMLSVAYAFRLIAHVFLGPLRDDSPHAPHDPGFGMWAAPALLCGLVVLIGLMPMTMAGPVVQVAADAVVGGGAYVNIYHWHGWVPALFLSVLAVGGGFLAVGLHATFQRWWDTAPRPEAKAMFDGVIGALAAAARGATGALHDGHLPRYIALAVAAIVAAGVWAFLGGSHAAGTRAMTPAPAVAVIGWGVLAAATVAAMVLHRNRLMLLILLSIVGLFVSVGFAYLAAPDLALTQITVEVVTIVLMLLALNFLPKETPVESSAVRRVRDLALAGAAGAGAAALAFAMLLRDAAFPTIAGFHLAASKPGAGGTNAVNTIIVDFRGYDTFGEIVVLGIAAIVIYALVEALFADRAADARITAWDPERSPAGDRHPLIMVMATRLILPVAMMIGVYLFLRGHNAPGGGFIAGLVFAIALVMQYLASGLTWTERRRPADWHAVIAVGVILAALTGIGAWFNGMPFLTSAFAYVHLGPMTDIGLATSAIFDLGVFLCVLGAVMLALASLSRVAVRTGETVGTRPFDIDPSEGA
jgi:multicomponent K+:H+ antiporter subunit A